MTKMKKTISFYNFFVFKQPALVIGIIAHVLSFPALEEVQDEIREAAMQANELLSDMHDKFAN